MRINWSPLAVINITDNLPEGAGGNALGPYIKIRPKYEKDMGILEHELTHVVQFWTMWLSATVCLCALGFILGWPVVVLNALIGLSMGTHPMLYTYVRGYKIQAEVAA